MNCATDIMERVETLPTLPTVFMKTVSLLDKKEIEISEIVNVIKYDPAITANTLKICNSAYYGLMRKVSSLNEAAVYVGTNELLKIALMGSSSDFLKEEIEGYSLDEGELFRHSTGCATASQLLLKKMNRQNQPILFTASLLHDIGKLVLSRFVKNDYIKIYKLVIQNKYTFIEAEKEILNITHADIGALLCEKWNFPQELSELIRYHHEPEKSPEEIRESIELIHLSDLMCLIAGIGIGADGMAYKPEIKNEKLLEIVKKDLNSLIFDLITEMEKIGNAFM